MYEKEKETILAIAPEFTETDDTILTTMLDIASNEVSKKAFGKSYTLAMAYYAAHLLTLRTITEREGGGGAGITHDITSEKEGNLSRSYGNGLSSDSFLSKSIYGIMFERLKKRTVLAVITRMG